ncbi:MAG: hypothetical protein KatS3mg129_0370 [Leptospiraceae bacterium]|nr:MAG: hypothetical protein KatS3mg129_0370 [Leptospiraceae bacterium]
MLSCYKSIFIGSMLIITMFIDLNPFYRDYGNISIFMISFLAATILPLSSDILVSIAFHTSIPKEEVLVYATIGNSLACILNYYIGYFIFKKLNNKSYKIFSFKIELPSENHLSYKLIQKYNILALLASWLPVIGDPITILSGYFKFPLSLFLFTVISLRFIRYYALFLYFN